MAQSSPSDSHHLLEADDRISMADVGQIERIAFKFGVSAVHLREVIAQVGPRLQDVAARLAQRDSVD